MSRMNRILEDTDMPDPQTDLEAFRLHAQWARRHAIIWVLFSLALFTGAFFLLEDAGVSEASRASLLVILATLLVVNTVWQAAGAVVARIETVVRRQDR
jgi:hypothetical protein